MTNLRRRVLALEARRALRLPQRIVVRFEGEEPDQPECEIDEGTLVVSVEYVDVPLPDVATSAPQWTTKLLGADASLRGGTDNEKPEIQDRTP